MSSGQVTVKWTLVPCINDPCRWAPWAGSTWYVRFCSASSKTHESVGTDGFDHINRNPPVPIRTPKLMRFEPAQYWGGGPPGNSVVLNPLFFVFCFCFCFFLVFFCLFVFSLSFVHTQEQQKTSHLFRH